MLLLLGTSIMQRILLSSITLLQFTLIYSMDSGNSSSKPNEGENVLAVVQDYQGRACKLRSQSRVTTLAYLQYLSTINDSIKKKEFLAPLKPTNKSSGIDFNKPLESFSSSLQGQEQKELEAYKKEKESLNNQSRGLFNNCLSKSPHAEVLILHPETFALRETISKIKEVVDSNEKEFNDHQRTRLFLDDLLLSVEINSLNAVLESIKKQTEPK